jgi:hypothetical protein
MDKFNNHIYWLLTLRKEEIVQRFLPAFGIALVYLIYTILRSIVFKNLRVESIIGSLLVFLVLGAALFLFYNNRLIQDVPQQSTSGEKQELKEPDCNISEEKTARAMEIHEEEVEQYMFFNDAVTALWESNNSAELTTVLANHVQHQISDIERIIR